MNTYQKIAFQNQYTPPSNWLTIKTIDMHTGGEPLRVIISGFPELKGNNVLDYRRYVKENYDYLRTALMYEPRGHADMYGCLIVPPNNEKSDFGVLFMHNEGYSTMCGHAIIALSKLAITLQWITSKEGENHIKIDAPCGLINSYVSIQNNHIKNIRFECVPSFVVSLDNQIEIPELGKITYDIAYGGAFYAYVDLKKNHLNLSLDKENYSKIIHYGKIIKETVINSHSNIKHPFESDLSFLYGVIFSSSSTFSDCDIQNVCVFADGEVDRSPTGSGVSGRLAIEYTRKNITINEMFCIESITQSIFKGKVLKEVEYGPFKAIIPEVSGEAFITGMHTFIIDPNDPLKNGFFLR